jgi:hypothetical protein
MGRESPARSTAPRDRVGRVFYHHSIVCSSTSGGSMCCIESGHLSKQQWIAAGTFRSLADEGRSPIIGQHQGPVDKSRYWCNCEHLPNPKHWDTEAAFRHPATLAVLEIGSIHEDDSIHHDAVLPLVPPYQIGQLFIAATQPYRQLKENGRYFKKRSLYVQGH